MRILKTLLLSAVLALAPLSIGTGCRAPHTAQQVAMKSLETTWQGVHGARRVYAQLYHAGKVDAATHARALEADAKFRLAFDSALDAAALDWKTITPATVAAAADSFITLVSGLTNKH